MSATAFCASIHERSSIIVEYSRKPDTDNVTCYGNSYLRVTAVRISIIVQWLADSLIIFAASSATLAKTICLGFQQQYRKPWLQTDEDAKQFLDEAE